jgi:outer membrane protein
MAKYLFSSLSVAILLIASSARAADEVPNNTVAVGGYWIFYHVHSTDVSGPFTPAGLNLDVKNLHTLYFAYLRRLSPHITLEFAGGLPPVTKTVGKGPATLGSVPYNGQIIATARWLAPSLLIKYVFFDENSLIRPYIGVGINYVNFYDRNSTPAGNAGAGGPTKIELPSSIGPAGTVGLALRLARNYGVTVSYSASRVRSHLTAITGDIQRSAAISFNPSALVVAASYSF